MAVALHTCTVVLAAEVILMEHRMHSEDLEKNTNRVNHDARRGFYRTQGLNFNSMCMDDSPSKTTVRTWFSLVSVVRAGQ